jgi:hypothetical protein
MGSMVENFTNWLLFGPNVATIIIIGTIYEIAKRAILGEKSERPKDGYTGFKKFYFLSYKLQAIAIGALIGLIPGLPIPEAFQSDGLAGAILNYAGCGGASMIVYTILIGSAKNYVQQLKDKIG